MTKQEKDFSIMKWMVFPALTFILGLGIIYNSVQIFGISGSVSYIGLIMLITVIGLIMVVHTGNRKNEAAKRAAFIFECAMVISLGVTCIASIYVARTMSGTRQAATQDIEKIKAIGTLKSRKAQAAVAGNIQAGTDLKAAFADAEFWMFWPLVGETLIALVALFTVFGLVSFKVGEGESGGETGGVSGHSLPLPSSGGSVRLSTATQGASFDAGSLPGRSVQYSPVANGAGATFSFKRSGQGYGLHFRERGGNSKHVVYLNNVEAPTWAAYSYKQIAEESAKRRESRHGKDEVVRAIEQTLI